MKTEHMFFFFREASLWGICIDSMYFDGLKQGQKFVQIKSKAWVFTTGCLFTQNLSPLRSQINSTVWEVCRVQPM